MKWVSMVLMECVECATDRRRRNRLIEPQDPRIRQSPFIDAPYVHQHNEPKCHALLLRAVENAKRGGSTPAHILWVVAQDAPTNPAEVASSPAEMQRKQQRWLQYHDQMTAGIPGLLPLYLGMRARVTEKISKTLGILKHTSCTVVGWELHPADKQETAPGERLLKYMPLCIYVKFQEMTERIHEKLAPGVFPLRPRRATWIVNRKTEAKISRKGFPLIPDYACAAHMVQGMTLLGVLADCGDAHDNPTLKDMLAGYVTLSRVRKAETILLLRAFSRQLFQQGPPPVPHFLMKLLRWRWTRQM